MRDPERITKVLGLVEKIWKEYPDLRLMQLLLNCQVGYNTEEDFLLERLKDVYMTIDDKYKAEESDCC